MREFRLSEVLVSASAFFLGVMVAFFAIGPALFADGDASGRYQLAAVILVVYLMIGAAFGAAAPDVWKSSGLLLAFPAAPVALIYCESDSVLCALVVVSATAAAVFGAWAGRTVRIRASKPSA